MPVWSCHTMQVRCPKLEGTARASVFQLCFSLLQGWNWDNAQVLRFQPSPCPDPWAPGSLQPCFVSLMPKLSVAIVLLICAWNQWLQRARARCPCARDGHHHHAHCWTSPGCCSAVGYTTPCILCQSQAVLRVRLRFVAVPSF